MKPQKTITAYCWASGKIEFGASAKPGSLKLVRGPSLLVRAIIDCYARHGYSRGLLLVPGVPEAGMLGRDPLQAVIEMRRLCTAELKRRMAVANKPANKPSTKTPAA